MDYSNKKMIDILPCGYLITTSDGLISFANQFILKALNYQYEDLIDKKSINDFFAIGVKIYFQTHIHPLLVMQGKVEEISIELVGANQTFPVLLNATVVKNDLDGADYYHYTFFDISQRKKYEHELLIATQKHEQTITQLNKINANYAALSIELNDKKDKYKKQKEIYQQISEVGRVGGWELDLITNKLYWSNVTKQIHEVPENYKPNLLTAFSFYKEGTGRDSMNTFLAQAIKSSAPFNTELQIVTAKGKEVWVKVQGCVERVKANTVQLPEEFGLLIANDSLEVTVRIYGTFQDIDEQKKLMLQIEQSNFKIEKNNVYYKNIIENNSFFIIKIDLNGNYSYLSPYFCQIMGIIADEHLGKKSIDYVIEEDRELCLVTVEKCFKDQSKTQKVILRRESNRGIITIQWEFGILKDEKGVFLEVLCIGYEITKLIEKQAELQKLLNVTEIQNKRLENFTHIISHNIRSHVANLSGIVSITNIDDEQECNTAFGLIKSTVNSLDETIHNLSEIISIQANTNLPLTQLNAFNQINKVIHALQILISKTKTKVNFGFNKNEQITANTAYFESIILNLFTNAIKYKAEDRYPIINLNIEKVGSYKVLSFTDNGLGIDLKKNGQKLFGMYNTFHGNEDAKGLGLFILKTQIDAMMGKIEVESELGIGTTFKIYFYEGKDVT